MWDPHNDKHISNLKKVQRRAARFVLTRHRNTSSVGDMLQQLKLSTLQHRRRTIGLTMLYKITTGQACARCLDLKLQPASGRRSRHSLQYQRFSCRTDYRSNTFFPRSVRDRNDPPPPHEVPPPLPWPLQVKGAIPLPVKSETLFLYLRVSLLTLRNTLK